MKKYQFAITRLKMVMLWRIPLLDLLWRDI
ncbi:hypothetical protein CFP56_025728 [Quercus suber]|uniref:Uncharacterized protein n=1 Tax=Quercus suber TaxID=58331 RepID=A0AAW0K2N0_QUESU